MESNRPEASYSCPSLSFFMNILSLAKSGELLLRRREISSLMYCKCFIIGNKSSQSYKILKSKVLVSGSIIYTCMCCQYGNSCSEDNQEDSFLLTINFLRDHFGVNIIFFIKFCCKTELSTYT